MMKNAVYYIFKKTQEKDSCKTEASKSCFTLSEKKELTNLKSSSAKILFSKVFAADTVCFDNCFFIPCYD